MKRLKFIAILIMVLLMAAPNVFAGSLASQRYKNTSDVKVCVSYPSTLPQSTQSAIFSISGGPIEVLGLTGEVTTIIQNQACSLRIVADPTTPSTDTNLCTDLTIANNAVGVIYTLSTSVATALAKLSYGAGAGMGGVYSLIVPVGDIDARTNASNTGRVKWRLLYRALDPASVVTASDPL